MQTTEQISALVRAQVEAVHDPSVRGWIEALLVPPYAVERDWDYGAPGEKYLCWTVLEHRRSGTGIAYCAQGFGPKHSWGLVWISGPQGGIGMDSGWFSTLEEAFRDSMAWEDGG